MIEQTNTQLNQAVIKYGGPDCGIKPVETKNLLGSIMSSDMDNSGAVSKSEISYKANTLDSQVNYLNMLKAYFPYWGEYLDNYITQAQTQLDSINIVKDNFDAFSKGDDAKVIDGQDIMNVVNAAKVDENADNFSQQDLDVLKVVPEPPPPIKTVNTDSFIENIKKTDVNDDKLISKQEISDNTTKLQSQIDYLNNLKNYYPSMSAYYDQYITQYQTQLDSLNIVKDNFEAFSNKGDNTEVIDEQDFANIKIIAGTDGNADDFTQEDLDVLKPEQTI